MGLHDGRSPFGDNLIPDCPFVRYLSSFTNCKEALRYLKSESLPISITSFNWKHDHLMVVMMMMIYTEREIGLNFRSLVKRKKKKVERKGGEGARREETGRGRWRRGK